MGREIPQYLSEEFLAKQTPVTGKMDREKWAGKRWEGNIHDREHIRKYAQKIDSKVCTKMDPKVCTRI